MRASFVVISQTLPFPNEDFRRPNKNVSECVSPGSTFQRFVGQIQYSQCHTLEKCFTGNALGNVCSAFENLRLVSIHLLQRQHHTESQCYHLLYSSLCSPNEDFRHSNEPFDDAFRRTLSRIVSALFWATMH
jgi:hypothetical protein